MADPKNPRSQPVRRSANTSTAASRAAQRKVVRDPDAPKAGGPPRRPATPAPPRAWYRRPAFWLVVIVAEMVAAFAISQVAPDKDVIALEGGDPALFCAQVAKLRDLHPEQASGSTDFAGLRNGYQAEADLLRKLATVAPTDLQPDMDQLAKTTVELYDAVGDIQQHRSADPSWVGALPELVAKQDDVDKRTVDAVRRFHDVANRECGIDLTAPVPATTTTAPAGTTVPGSPGSAPSGSDAPGTTPGTQPGSTTGR